MHSGVRQERNYLTAHVGMGAAASSSLAGKKEAGRDVHWACRRGDVVALRRMIADKVPLDTPDNGQWTPLLWACSEGHSETVRLLLESGADANRTHGKGGTPLLTVAFKGHTEIAKLLLEHKADCDKANSAGETPVHLASRQGQSGVVRLLLDGKADVTKVSSSCETPLDVAKSPDIKRMIMEMAPVRVSSRPTTSSRKPNIFYHATSLEAALRIQDQGFRVDLSGTNAGARLGPGVYCTTMMKKAMNYCDEKKPGGGVRPAKSAIQAFFYGSSRSLSCVHLFLADSCCIIFPLRRSSSNWT